MDEKQKDEAIQKAIGIAKFIIRQINKPVNINRRRDDWKFNVVIANLERMINILEGGEDYIHEGAKTGKRT